MRSFEWILAGKLAGAGRPGLMGSLDDELRWLRAVGIRLVVSLTRKPLELPPECGLRGLHFPIPDMGIPTPRAAMELCSDVLAAMARSEPVVLHCKAGLGRTGTMLAATLVSLGDDAERAISAVRRVSTYYIQTPSQEQFVHHYADFLRELDRRGELPPGFVAPRQAAEAASGLSRS